MARRQFRPAAVVVLALLLLSWSHVTTLAQQAPAASATGSFQLTDETGAPLAEIAVTAVADPFQDVAEGYEASPEGRLVAITATVTNAGSAAFEVRPDYFVAQDADGYLWRQTSVQLPENPVIPVMDQVQIAPGDRITGLLVFELPAQAALATLVYQPESSRVLLIASLGQPGAPAPGVGSQVRIADTEAGTEAVLTVVEWQDPFEDVAEGGEPEAGSRYLLATIAVENVGTAPLDVSSSDFLLRDSQGYLWSTTSVRRGEDVVVPDMQSQTLAPGNRITGVIGFQLETSAQTADVLYQPVSGRLITLAGIGAGATTAATPAASVGTTDCTGVDAWHAATNDRLTRATLLSQQAAQLENPQILESAALEFQTLASDQAAMDVPAATAALNARLVESYTAYADALTRIANAGEDGSDPTADVAAGADAFNAVSRDLAAVQGEIATLAAECGIVT